MGEASGGKFAIWKCDNCGDVTLEEISPLTYVGDEPMPRFGWGCTKYCKTETQGIGRRLIVKVLSVADFNPFFEFGPIGPNLTGTNWMDFWALCDEQWAEQFKYQHYYGEEDPDYVTCPFCGLVGSCMCEEIAQKELDPEGLGLEEDCPY